MDRREFLGAAAGAAAAVGVAGCVSTGGGSSEPPYVRWVGTDVVARGGPAVRTYEAELLERVAGTGQREPVDLEYVPEDAVVHRHVADLKMRTSLGVVPDALGVLEPAEGGSAVDRIVSIAGFVGTVDGGWVIEGSFDEGEVADSLTEAEATEEGTHGGYRLYSLAEDDLFAVSPDALLSAPYDGRGDDPTAPVEAMVDAGNGDATRYSEAYDAYDDLASTLSDDPVTYVDFVPEERRPLADPDDGSDEGTTETERDWTGRLGSAAHVDFGRDRTTAGLAFRYVTETDVDDEAAYEDRAAAADELSVSVDGPLVTLDVTYVREGS